MKKDEMLKRKYPSRRRELIRFLQEDNENLGQGLDYEDLGNAILMIIDYFNYNLPNIKIPAKAIPDRDEFKEKNFSEYTVEQFVYNRVYANLKKCVVTDRPPEGKNPYALGGYTASTKTLTLYKENIRKRFDETCKIIGEEYRESLIQEVIIHELIHAISKTKENVTGVIYRDENNVRHNVSLNEGITERLAMDICELPDVFMTVKKDDFQVSANTTSSYKLETGIANLLSIIDGEKFYLKYLVDAKRITIKREEQDLMDITKKVTDNHQPTRDVDLEREKVNDYQRLQDILIRDIFNNKLQKELLDPVRLGENIDVKNFKKLRKDMYEIGKCLIPTLKDIDGEEVDLTMTASHIREMINQGKIDKTPNVDKFIALIGAMKEVERDMGIAKGKNDRVKYNR